MKEFMDEVESSFIYYTRCSCPLYTIYCMVGLRDAKPEEAENAKKLRKEKSAVKKKKIGREENVAAYYM